MQGTTARTSRVWRVVAPAVIGVLAMGCTTASSMSESADPSTNTSASASATQEGSSVAAAVPFDPATELDATFESQVFLPPLRVKLPADWVPIERDPAAFQIYFGTEEYEITIDHTYQQPETAEVAMARLLSAPYLTAQGQPESITIGGQSGLTVVVDASAPVEWSDSGYHTNLPDLRVRLVTVPVEGGETVSIFVVANTSADEFAPVDQIALRILSTLEWVAS